MSSSLESALQAFGAEAREGLSSFGVQVFVAVDDEVLADVAYGTDGLGRELTTETQHRVYCAGKPLGALAVGRLVDVGQISWNDRLEHVIERPLPAAMGSLTIEQILRHRGGLFRVRGSDVVCMPSDMRTNVVIDAGTVAGLDQTSAYAEFGGWHLLGLVIEALTGARARDFIHTEILKPWNLQTEIRVGLGSRDDPPSTPNVDLAELKPVPMLLSSTHDACHHGEIADQVIATARGLGRLYMELGKVLAGQVAPEGDTSPVAASTLAYMLRPSDSEFDPAMGRECSYGAGFMTKLSEHLYGRLCSERSFGHSGYKGVTFGFHDPATGVSMAVHENGVLDVETSLNFRRARRVDLVLRALASDLESRSVDHCA